MSQATRHPQDPYRTGEEVAETKLANLLSKLGVADPQKWARHFISELRNSNSNDPSLAIIQQGKLQDTLDALEQCKNELATLKVEVKRRTGE